MKNSKKIKIFIVEDSHYIKDYLKKNLQDTFEIVGEASDGVAALKSVFSAKPDVVLLDLMMPKMNGDVVAKAIIATNPIPIIILTSLTEEEIKRSFGLLENYVVDIVKKPLDLNDEFIKILNRKIIGASNLKLHSFGKPLLQEVDEAESVNAISGFLLTIGVSTGGPKTLRQIMPKLSSVKNLPILIIQHIEKGFEKSYVDWLRGFCLKEVLLVDGKLKVDDKIYVCPPDKNIELSTRNGSLIFVLKNIENNQLYYPSIDNILDNFADKLKNKLIHLQLTGLGNDGQTGAKKAKELGATIICENPENAIASSMPESVRDFADYVVEISDISKKIIEVVSRK